MRCKWIKDDRYLAFEGKNILVAGGTGFIGTRVVEVLKQLGLNIFVISRKTHCDEGGIIYGRADLGDAVGLKKLFSNVRFDYAVYMAANIPLRGVKRENYFDAKRSTFDPFVNFCEVFLPQVSKFVYISSIDVVGGCSDYEYDEMVDIKVATPYGLAKYIGEFYVRDVCKTMEIPYSILRFSQVYGPNEPIVRIIPIIKKAMREKTPFTLVTDGNEKRRFLFVDDAVKAIVNGLLFAQSETYNIAGPDVISMRELVELIENTWGGQISLTIKGELPGEDNVPSYKKAKEQIGFEPEVNMIEGMKIIAEEEKC